jgi:hypothetical protein
MENKQIMDNIILVQEEIHINRTNEEKGMLIKLDIANAFDWVRNSFMFIVLRKFGFA